MGKQDLPVYDTAEATRAGCDPAAAGGAGAQHYITVHDPAPCLFFEDRSLMVAALKDGADLRTVA